MTRLSLAPAAPRWSPRSRFPRDRRRAACRPSSARRRSRGRCRRRRCRRTRSWRRTGAATSTTTPTRPTRTRGPGPLGRNMQRLSTFQGAECASVTFDRAGRIVAVCVGRRAPAARAARPAHARPAGLVRPAAARPEHGRRQPVHRLLRRRLLLPRPGRPRGDLDHAPGTSGSSARPAGRSAPAFALERDYDVSAAVPLGDSIISALPDWSGPDLVRVRGGRGRHGRPGQRRGAARSTSARRSATRSRSTRRAACSSSPTARMYRFDATAAGAPAVTWREPYANTGVKKPGQTEAGSGTTPTLMGSQYVAITDNADPMDVVVYRRGEGRSTERRLVCTQPVFEQGAGDTDQSLIGAGRSLVVENNYGYSGLDRDRAGRHAPRPGIERVDIDEQRHRLPQGLAQRRARAVGRAEAVARDRARLHLHEAADERRHRRLVLHGDRLPHRQDRLQAPRRHRARLQQQLRAGEHRPRRAQPTWARSAGSSGSGTASGTERTEDPPDREARRSPTAPAARSGSRGSPAPCSRRRRWRGSPPRPPGPRPPPRARTPSLPGPAPKTRRTASSTSSATAKSVARPVGARRS